ncbi:MAG: tetratricopeptide repeat protein, partial [Candidatus Polarisedimenticolaceae bacterium]|nr:tetratricopeptide repeat protein [Candidatus Polarisedimenticolaceae bacterium]
DLSVSLDNVGKVSQQQGRWGDAQVAYEESLELSRRLVGVLGESPESLRDLTVSLHKLGQFNENHGTIKLAKEYYKEGLVLARRLAALLPDLPLYHSLPEYFITGLKNCDQ